MLVNFFRISSFISGLQLLKKNLTKNKETKCELKKFGLFNTSAEQLKIHPTLTFGEQLSFVHTSQNFHVLIPFPMLVREPAGKKVQQAVASFLLLTVKLN